ncbi:N-acetylmuramic acid 6-phosphate etherase [Gracilibacillus caseinilyticus]|uniref:N-acetylmuramic acid 6-phosphate etherase n=1 Tax=Gracilibacillus caseinilyticus TaxID=2932256 RepID=A0ABY4EQS4_9BACI|nr:N-acetylmuramic acid 6-phosphate etherase [Gracilibacillus caseinilyticus]UOQ46710.1 N-acetylmuramic acid 6-phosphate etherase [Gracilibacillus caseinilyticus]
MAERVTEQKNEHSINIDEMEALDIVNLMHQEDQRIHKGIEQALQRIADAVDLIVTKWRQSGRVFVAGAGTSGRVGVLDAVELGPTFSVDPDRWIAFVAGGRQAMWEPLEQHEDSETNLINSLEQYNFNSKDVVIGISASGFTPYSVSALTYARDIGASTISISCNHETISSEISDVAIELVVGPEIIRGSTRLKAGTAQKMVINMISTAVMVRLGKVYQNEMVDMQLVNKKLMKRAETMLTDLTMLPESEVQQLMMETNQDIKLSLLIAKTGCDLPQARDTLIQTSGHVKQAIQILAQQNNNN